MTPTCRTSSGEDGGMVYCPLKETTWLVHHVSAETIRCMFKTDLRAGYYRRMQGGKMRLGRALLVDNASDSEKPYPSLCGCVDRHKRPRGGRRRGAILIGPRGNVVR